MPIIPARPSRPFNYSRDGAEASVWMGFRADWRNGVTFAEARARGAADFARGVAEDCNAFDLWTPRHREEWAIGYRNARMVAPS